MNNTFNIHRIGNIEPRGIFFSSHTLALSSPHCSLFIFPFTSTSQAHLTGTVFSLLFCQATMGPQILFLGNDAADKLARHGALLVRTAVPCSLFLLLVSTLLSDWRCIVSSKFFDTQVSSASSEKLALPRHARCALFRLCCNGHSLL